MNEERVKFTSVGSFCIDVLTTRRSFALVVTTARGTIDAIELLITGLSTRGTIDYRSIAK